MAENNETNLLFGATFDPGGIVTGANKTVENLEKVKESVVDLKQELKNINRDFTENERLIKAGNEALKRGIGDQELVKKNLAILAENQETLNRARKDAVLGLATLNKVEKDIQKSLNQTTREHEKATEAVKKLTSVHEFAAEGVNKVRRGVTEFGLGLASGLVGVIIGQAIPSIDKLVEGFLELVVTENNVFNKTKLLNDIQEKAVEGYSASVSKLELFKTKLNDLTIPESERLKIAKEYNKTAEEGNKLDLTQINNLDLINEKIEKQIKLLKERALAKAAENILAEKAGKLFTAQLKEQETQESLPSINDLALQNVNNQIQRSIDAASNQRPDAKKLSPDEALAFATLPPDQLQQILNANDRLILLQNPKLLTQLRELGVQKKLIDDARAGLRPGSNGLQLSVARKNTIEAQEDFDKTLEAIAGFVTIDGLTTQDKTSGKQVENVFKQKLLELQERLAKVLATEFQSDSLIKKEFFAKLQKEEGEIDNLLKQKKLTEPQADFLKGLLSQINQEELEKSLSDFHNKQRAALKKVNDELEKLYIEDAQARVNNIRDDLQRQQAVIDQQYTGALQAIKKRQKDLFDQIDKEVEKGFITKEQSKKKKTLLSFLFSELESDIEVQKANAKLDLALKTFEKTLTEARETFNSTQLGLSEATTQDISKLTDQYQAHEITYEQYQKRLTKILEEETAKRREQLRDELISEFVLLQQEIDKTSDPKNKKALQDKQEAIRAQINDLNRAIETGEAAADKKDKDERIQRLVTYAQAIGTLTNQIISFWQKTNEAERVALERSISLQEKRVEAAQRIADRGNAEYLRQEEDRLTQLNIKQEENAKRTLAINAVLAGSQALVAFVTALAQGAALGGPLGAIAAAGALVALIASASSIVKSLQDSSPRLFKGSKYVTRDGQPAGIDTIPAMINEGEAVIPTDTNKEYHPAVAAIYDKTIPADVLNNFVKSYPSVNIPKVNYDAIGESATFMINQDGVLVNLISEQIKETKATKEVMLSVDNRLKKFGFKFNWDKRGVSASVMQAIKDTQIQKKV